MQCESQGSPKIANIFAGLTAKFISRNVSSLLSAKQLTLFLIVHVTVTFFRDNFAL